MNSQTIDSSGSRPISASISVIRTVIGSAAPTKKRTVYYVSIFQKELNHRRKRESNSTRTRDRRMNAREKHWTKRPQLSDEVYVERRPVNSAAPRRSWMIQNSEQEEKSGNARILQRGSLSRFQNARAEFGQFSFVPRSKSSLFHAGTYAHSCRSS